jgi:hypothetical protein
MLIKILRLTIASHSVHALPESEKELLFEWLAIFYGSVLNSSEWIETLRLKHFKGQSPGRTSSASDLFGNLTNAMTGLVVGHNIKDLRRFYDGIQSLAEKIESICIQPPPGSEDTTNTRKEEQEAVIDEVWMRAIEVKPFETWLIDMKEHQSSHESMSSNDPSRKGSWFGGLLKSPLRAPLDLPQSPSHYSANN